MKKLLVLVLLWISFVQSGFASPAKQITRADYFAYMQAAAEQAWANYEANLKKWRENIDLNYIFGYSPPSGPIYLALVSAFLYQETGKSDYLAWAKRCLLEYGELKKAYPDSWIKSHPQYKITGMPAVANIFTGHKYFQAYEMIKDKAGFTKSQKFKIENWIAESADYVIATQEWGAMNRGILRAEFLVRAARAVPDHPRTEIWRMYAKAIGDDNWGKWEIEDATGYHGVWLWSLMSYADAIQDESLYQTPEMYYYFHYFLNLISPHAAIPEFGDAGMNSSWNRFVVFFEKGAAIYNNPHLKWAANRILQKNCQFNSESKSIYLAGIFLDCYRWSSDTVKMIPPIQLSDEVMEDIQGKKIVFRNGWDEKSTYMLLNYRDEGDGGLADRDFLRNTIPVEEEKMTHGHADENSICLYMHDGCVLLRDAGYRDYMPSGPYGAYRQDYFHNRVCVRQEKIWMGQKQGEHRYQMRDAVPQQPILEFLRNAGSYRRVRTQKVDFLTFEDWDMSRTRLIDEKLGYEWDRIINYVKKPEVFIIFDIVRASTEEYFTIANLWHTRKIVAQGEHWYDTVYDSLKLLAFPTHKHLLIYFPDTDFRIEGVEKQRRYYQDEWTIHQTAARHFFQQDFVVFTTVLIPHDRDADITQLMQNIQKVKVDKYPQGVGIKVIDDDRTVVVCAKMDLQMDLIRDNLRPRYTYEAGKIRYDQFETDANNLFAIVDKKKMKYIAVNTVQLNYRDKIYFKQSPMPYGLSFDGKPDRLGKAKLRYWKDQVKLDD